MMESPAAPATWVTFAGGYQSVYQALILVLAGVVLYPFLKATGRTPARSPHRKRSGGAGDVR